MTALPVSYYLTDLSGEAQRRGRGFASLGAQDGADVELRISEAHARGVVEGRAAADAEHDARAVAVAEAFEQRLAAERTRWADEHGAQLGALVASAFETIEQRIADSVSGILGPILVERARVRATDELSRVIKDLLSKGEYAKIAISGPADLLAVLEARLANGHAGLSFAATDAPDVTVTANETILATQIGAWAAAISEGDQ
ncbi:hypothetical protein [Hyphomicrobium sp. CS1GBMeth3]|uniref:hypothetical protein n=1 Tax=Hyphomicrobium sp. CS1GBMeth3 TaxID=1892845 RepID=UPI000B26C66E|nr:hypothetical protein [Hyphomicrobium sp. CS1GBMeth3]